MFLSFIYTQCIICSNSNRPGTTIFHFSTRAYRERADQYFIYPEPGIDLRRQYQITGIRRRGSYTGDRYQRYRWYWTCNKKVDN
ncbi:MAG TPA: hypothetical protein ENH98_02820 [archaeon]|nr:hypothetical protein [archaeon]